MKLTLTGFVTLDGVCQGPGSPTQDTSDGFTRGGWLVPHIDQRFVGKTVEWLGHADGLLLGRRTYEEPDNGAHGPGGRRGAHGAAGREVQMHGSARLGRSLLAAGAGRHGAARRGADRCRDREVTPNGLLLLEYEHTGTATVAEYEGVTAFVA